MFSHNFLKVICWDLDESPRPTEFTGATLSIFFAAYSDKVIFQIKQGDN